MNRRGMTLMEVLLALALFAMLALFVAGTVRSVLGIWQQGERRGRGDLVFAAAMERIRGDLAALHTGPRGWLILDDWEPRAPSGNEPAWRLPRIRFLARGAALPADDPLSRRGVEIAWLMVPETTTSRLCRLVRLAQIEGSASGFAQDDAALLRRALSTEAMVVLDGVAWGEFEFLDNDGAWKSTLGIAANQPYSFPSDLRINLERVAGNFRNRPPSLDQGLPGGATAMVLRGTPPLQLPEYALVGAEWMRIRGNYPRLTVVERGSRNTSSGTHPRGATVWLPEPYSGSCPVAAGGRRLP